MQEIQVEVREARIADIERIQQLQQQARRSCVRYGYEDLVRMLERDLCFIADTGPLLWGFICAVQKEPEMAQIRGVSLINGWRVDNGIGQLLAGLEATLRRDQVQYIMHLALESWLAEPLTRQRFQIADFIVNYERAVPRRPLAPDHLPSSAHLRFLAHNEIGALAALDQRAFAWPWRFSSGELVKLLMTSSRLVVLEEAGELAGYACTDIQGLNAQIVRVAVDPAHHGKGLGRHLLADALDYAAAQGADTISLNTQWRNGASQRLYKGFGFRIVGPRIPVMIKQLDTP